MEPLPVALKAALAALVCLAGYTDWRTRRIPNWLAVAGVAAGFLLHLDPHPLEGLKTAALGFGLGLLIYLPLFALGGKGGGDVKLMAAVGALAGPKNCFAIFLLAALMGGAAAVALLIWRGGLLQALLNVGYILGRLVRGVSPRQERPELDIRHPNAVSLPYAIVIAAATLVFLVLPVPPTK